MNHKGKTIKAYFTIGLALLLSACAGGLSGNSEMYGEIKTGVETSRTRIGN
ncbi:hypothetical protein [Neisseria yangbaofengii]|uniref:hypothetical protein n=1 Tax=Neisseria yangbaofengii TaxID=2709396 RepID=UPI0013EE3AEF|nr:hypothetical protein [Neisseria yangbaofengii]